MEKDIGGGFRKALRLAKASGAKPAERGDGYVLYEYPDYETYRRVQQNGNKAKIGWQFVKKSHIIRLAGHLKNELGNIRFGICHGTRSGREQKWFRALFPQADVIGTEISETASRFPNTVQWDFHDPNPAWEGKADFVYSNSWDHAFAPRRAFSTWLSQLRPGGMLLLDYTVSQSPDSANALDPFGAELPALLRILREIQGEEVVEPEILDYRDNEKYRAQVVTLRRM